MENLAPIVLFVYNRPSHTLRTLEALEKCDLANYSTLYIFCDGPKINSDQFNLKKIAEVREIVKLREWCKKVVIYESSLNKGLTDSITSGITKIINIYGRVIVLEDDIIVTRGFLKYCNDALEIYKDDSNVMQIGASSYNSGFISEDQTYFAKVLQCWGWATWKRSWDKYNHDALDHLTFFQSDALREFHFDIEGSTNFMKQLRLNVSGELDTWAVRWYASWLREGGITLFPVKSLVENIGFDGTGQNSGINQSYLSKTTDFVDVKKILVKENKQARALIGLFWKKYTIENSASSICKTISNLIQRFLLIPIIFIRKCHRRFLMFMYPEIRELFKFNNGFGFNNLLNKIKGSWIHNSVKISNPCNISWSRINKHTYLSSNCNISYTEIGSFCSIGPNLVCGWGIHPIHGISTSPSFYSNSPANDFKLNIRNNFTERKKITIGNDVFIGMNVTILDGVKIGDGAVIGAGCVVTKDVPSYSVVIGAPMKILRQRFSPDIQTKLMEIKWWNWNEEDLTKVEEYFFNVEQFILNQ